MGNRWFISGCGAAIAAEIRHRCMALTCELAYNSTAIAGDVPGPIDFLGWPQLNTHQRRISLPTESALPIVKRSAREFTNVTLLRQWF